MGELRHSAASDSTDRDRAALYCRAWRRRYPGELEVHLVAAPAADNLGAALTVCGRGFEAGVHEGIALHGHRCAGCERGLDGGAEVLTIVLEAARVRRPDQVSRVTDFELPPVVVATV